MTDRNTYAARLNRLQKNIASHSLDGILVSDPVNIRYLTGLPCAEGSEREYWCLITADGLIIFADSRYFHHLREHVRTDLPHATCALLKNSQGLADNITTAFQKKGKAVLGFEDHNLTYKEYESLARYKATIKKTSSLVSDLRAVKEPREIKTVREACRRTDEVWKKFVKSVALGASEAQLASSLVRLIESGGDEISFYPIVAIDEHAAIPHFDTRHNGTAAVIKSCIILVDFGVRHGGYCADMTRMIFVGTPSSEIASVYAKLLKAQLATLGACTTATSYKEIDSTSRAYMKRVGLDPHPHSTGHGVGLAIHELPGVGPTSETLLQKGHVITIEPGHYKPGAFGMRIEDTVAIGEKGTYEVLTRTSKELLTLSL